MKRELIKTAKHPVLVAVWKSLPAEQVQYLCLVVGGYDGPGELVKTGSGWVFEDSAHHCTSVYGVSRVKTILGFLDGGLPSMTAACLGS